MYEMFRCLDRLWCMRRKELTGCGHMRKTNRESARIPPFGLSESDLLILTFASLLCSLAPPSSGTFGQILSPLRRLHFLYVYIFFCVKKWRMKWGGVCYRHTKYMNITYSKKAITKIQYEKFKLS